MLAQDVGFPVPVGGAGRLTGALVARGASVGAQLECGQPVDAIEVRDGRAVAVHTAGGRTIRVRRAVVADVSAPALYLQLMPRIAIPDRLRRDLAHFTWDTPVVKVNYALDAPVPWRSQSLRGAGTVHLGADHHGLIRWVADLNTATVPDKPFILFGQMTTTDPSRSPSGTESAWAYTHLPRETNDDESADRLAAAVDRVLRGTRTRLRRPGRRENRPTALGSGRQRRELVRRRHQRRHRPAATTDRLPAYTWLRPRRNPRRQRLSG